MVFGFTAACAQKGSLCDDGCKKHTGEKLKNFGTFMGYCRSPLEGSTHVCFSRGGGVSHRIAGVKPHLKKSKQAGFSHGDACGRTLFPDEKCQRDI